MDRREFMKGAALGVGAGVLGSMGLYSYSPGSAGPSFPK